MKRKLLITVILAIASILCMLSFAACSEKNGDVSHRKHNYLITVVDSTCTEQGYTLYKCSCGDEYRDNFVDVLGHKFGEYDIDNAATCTKNGTKTAKCIRCAEKKSEIIVAEGHKTSSFTPLKSLTHGKQCEKCNNYIEELPHDYNSENICSICGYENKPNAELTYTLSDDNTFYSVSGWYLVVDEIIIPSYYNGKPVKMGENESFNECEFKSITLAMGITEIPNHSFMNLTELENIIIPSSVTTVGKLIFQGCDSLTDIWVECSMKPEGWDEDWLGVAGVDMNNVVVHWGDEWQYVYGKPVLKSEMETEDGEHEHSFIVSKIDPTCVEKGYTLHKCSCGGEYKDLFLEATGKHVFKDYIYDKNATCVADGTETAQCEQCGATDTRTKIYSSGHIYEDYFCSRCGQIAPNAPETEGLLYSTIIERNDIIGYSVSKGDAGFRNYINVPCYYQGKPVLRIENNAFINCTKLKSITIPNGVLSVGSYAFSGCSSLLYIEIPNSVTSIGEFAFDNCSSLMNIIVATNNPNYSSQDGVLYNKNKTKFIHVPIAIEGNITIPSSITKIDARTFADCRNLIGIEIPNSVTSIGEAAFFGCSGLTSITMPLVGDENSKYYNKYLLGELFGSNSYVGGVKTSQNYYGSGISYYGTYYIPATLRSVTITGGVGVDRSTFFHCSGLTSIKILKNITKIEGYAFAGCSGLTNLEIPSSVTSIGDYAFHTCSSLTSIEIPNKVTQIGWLSFYGCSSLTNITVPSSVTSIYDSAFKGCSSLTIYCEVSSKPSGWHNDWNKDNECAVVWNYKNNNKDNNGYIYRVIGGIRYSLKDNEATVIRQPGDLDCVILPNSVIYNGITYYVVNISDNAFNDCINLTSVAIPESISNIGDDVFKNCRCLTIYCETKSKPNGWSNDWNKYGCPVIWNYKNNDKDNNGYAYSIINDIRYSLKNRVATVICQPANIQFAFLPSSVKYNGITYYVTSINDNAFYNCTSLMGVTISNGIKIIGKSAFCGCSSLISIEMGKSVTSIGYGAFWDCSSLTSIEIPISVTSIGDKAFYHCSGLASINVTHGNAKYHSSENCLIETATKTLVVGCNNSVIPANGNVTSIGDSAFENCVGIKSITIPDGVTIIGYYAFSGCTSLTSITIPNSIEKIGADAFYKCDLTYNEYSNGLYLGSDGNKYFILIKAKDTSITSLSIHENTKIIYGNAFFLCRNLSKITIPINVTSIGFGSFWGCSGLTNIIIPNSVKYIESRTFNGCSSLTSIIIPNSINYIGNCAFADCDNLANVIFENINGWFGKSIYTEYSFAVASEALADSNTAATYLTSRYLSYDWYHN